MQEGSSPSLSIGADDRGVAAPLKVGSRVCEGRNLRVRCATFVGSWRDRSRSAWRCGPRYVALRCEGAISGPRRDTVFDLAAAAVAAVLGYAATRGSPPVLEVLGGARPRARPARWPTRSR